MIVQDFPTEKQDDFSQLKILENRYERSRQRIWWWLSVPLLWISAWLIADWAHNEWVWELFGLWCVTVLLLIGLLIYKRFPSKETVIHDYSQFVLPKLFAAQGVQDVRVARKHDLATKVFLESGLYHDKYNAISREDSIQGTIDGRLFGMYEVAMQIGSTRVTGRTAIASSTRTNQFYGWFVIVNTARIPGFHFITMRERRHGGESDDWHRKTVLHWERDVQLQKIQTGNPLFDQRFLLNSDQPNVLYAVLTPTMQEFLLYLAHTTKNSFAISIQKSRVMLLIGHENASFRKCPDGDFTRAYPAELVEDVKWFVELVRGLSRMKAG